MQSPAFPALKRPGLVRALCLLFAATLSACGGGSSAPVANPPATPVGPGYTVVNLAPVNPLDHPQINARGEAAFSILRSARYQGMFFDGTSTRDIGSLGGASTIVRSMNDQGQVVGTSSKASGRYHAFLWSCCMRDLGTLGGAEERESSEAFDINARGQVVGISSSNAPFNPGHAFLWTEAGGMQDLGTLSTMTGGGSIAKAINASGQVAGDFDVAVESIHAFMWSATAGSLDLGTLGGPESFSVDINDAGQVVGNSTPTNAAERFLHAFVWSRQSGMVDLGTLGGAESNAAAMNSAGQVVGIAAGTDGVGHAFIWTQSGGMADLGTLGGNVSRALAINDRGQVGGSAEVAGGELHAFVWSAGSGMVDLNSRVLNAPPQLVLSEVLAIADNGMILAASDAGLVLLKPGSSGGPSPVVGAITPAGPVPVGVPVVFSVSFNDTPAGETHGALWSWGDGSADTTGTVDEANGTATGSHVFSSPGVYPILVKVTDSAGHATTVARNVEAQ